MLKFQYDYELSTLSASDVRDFLERLRTQKLTPYFKSQDVHEFIKEANPVKHIVGKDFMKSVSTPGMDTFIKFYSDDCQKCVEIAPHWERVAKEVASLDNLVMAQFNYDLNEIPGIKITELPTLILVRNGDPDDQVRFDMQGFHVGNLKSFLKTHSKVF